MALDKLCDLYTFDTSAFYTDDELQLNIKLNKSRRILNKIKTKYSISQEILNSFELLRDETDPKKIKKIESNIRKSAKKHPNKFYYENIVSVGKFKPYNIDLYHRHVKIMNDIIKNFKSKLKDKINENLCLMRNVRQEHLNDKNIVAIFDSNLTRSLNMKFDRLNLEMIIVKVYYFDIMKSIINNGFYLNNEKYVFFSASAGQIRTKKFVAVRENDIKYCWNQITCGLSLDSINSQGGVNRNKYLAYLALCNSATDVWNNFDIDKSIVVDDLETMVYGEVDFIDEKFNIKRKFMNVPINHTDGCGMINYGNKNFMCRAPWIKGLLSPFRFRDFIKKYNCNPIVRDIYGKEYNIIEDDIQVILTKSQFKMWKYYKNWDEYKENFKKYGCTFGICNEENTFDDSVLSYQMLQTLTDITDEELQYICYKTKSNISKLSSDLDKILKVFKATKNNPNKNYFQQCLLLYPELIKDNYTKDTLRAIKNKLEKEAWAGKLNIYGKYLFVIPDLYAFCEYLFMDNKNPNGLLNNGEVYSKLFKNINKLDCLRSPHLYREHAIRNNVAKSKEEFGEWFISNGVYISCHDLISKIVQCDFDGDVFLTVGDEKFVKIAERNMSNIVPLYYEMGKAAPQIIDNETLYEGLILAFIDGNIGTPSNEITKVWNSDNVDLDIIKIQCAMVNFTIDAAKTLYKPEFPKDIKNKINAYKKNKLPHFFIYAKDKEGHQVEAKKQNIKNMSTVDKIKHFIPPSKLTFNNTTLGEFNYRMLMANQDVQENELYFSIIKKYKELTKNINSHMSYDESKIETNNLNYLFRDIKEELLLVCNDVGVLTDNLIYYLFFKRKTSFKYVFWQCFGDVIFKNIKTNMQDNYIYCEKCGKRFFREHFNEHLCEKCRKYKKIEKKTVICIDCGKEFEVDGIVKKQTRCTECYNIHRNIKNKEKSLKYYHKNK